MMKRFIDILVALCGLILCLPLFVMIAVLIKLDSPGPIFFTQRRTGKGFRTFDIYKFRSMVQDASNKGGGLTIGRDSRVTRIGTFLREYKLDELPQLINVLKGEMSLVGPRPELPRYVEQFRDEYSIVLTVRPGLTDLASLRYINESKLLGKFDSPEEEYLKNILPQKIRMAIMYIEHASLTFDMAILVQTFFNIFGVRVDIFKFHKQPHDGNDHTFGFIATSKKWILICRRPLVITLDLLLIILANYLAFWLRFDGQIPDEEYSLFLQTLPWLLLIRGVIFSLFRLNEGLWRYTSVWDLQCILIGVSTSTLIFYAVVHWGFGFISYPRSIFIVDSILLIGFLSGIRLPKRLYREGILGNQKKRVLIIGAGDSGEMIVREMKGDPLNQYKPIGFVDDDPSIVGQRIHGVKVLGPQHNIGEIIDVYNPNEVWVAHPGNHPAAVREIIKSMDSFKGPIKTLPNRRDLMNGKFMISQIRPLAIEDLLERPPIEQKSQGVRHLISGKRIMVTGAGGTIGSELCRQIVEFDPQGLILYERYENNLFAISNELADRKYPFLLKSVIGDVTDRPRVLNTLKEFRPHIIFHAAAHKHVPLMESNPGEALKNNVLGSRVMAEAAEQCGVDRFVLISTDKAVNPSSVMGATKRIAELMIQEMAHRSRTCYLTVRFGNVLGSNGSVVPRFQEQIKAGGPVTVTHPEVRRYFMLISEAVHLVLQSATLGERGAIYVLDMGEQIKLIDLAHNLIRLSGFVPERDIPITFVGLRPGEKIEEELVGDGERVEPSSIAKIQRLRIDKSLDMASLCLDLKRLEETIVNNKPSKAMKHMQQILPNFQPLEKPIQWRRQKKGRNYWGTHSIK